MEATAKVQGKKAEGKKSAMHWRKTAGQKTERMPGTMRSQVRRKMLRNLDMRIIPLM